MRESGGVGLGGEDFPGERLTEFLADDGAEVWVGMDEDKALRASGEPVMETLLGGTGRESGAAGAAEKIEHEAV